MVRIQGLRLGEAAATHAGTDGRGEAVALLGGAGLVAAIVAATEAASVRPVAMLDAGEQLADALGPLDGLLRTHGTVVIAAPLDSEDVPLLLQHVDRAVALVGGEDDWARVAALGRTPAVADRPIEIVLHADAKHGDGVVHRLPADAEPAWLGRHLARTKLGLALGAGGAKGYAHIGALQVIEHAGYTDRLRRRLEHRRDRRRLRRHGHGRRNRRARAARRVHARDRRRDLPHDARRQRGPGDDDRASCRS